MAEDPRKIPRDPREPLLRLPDGCTEGAHLNSPAGGPGPGRFRDTLRRELIKGGARVIVGPLGSILTDYLVDHEENAKNVFEACDRALKNHVGQAIEEETGRALKEVLEGILPGLIFMLAIVAASTGLGAGAGAAIGALAAGVGAAPGAVVGAKAGFHLGIWILNWLGLASLAVYVGTNLSQVTSLLVPAVERAWNAGKHCKTKEADIDAAARQIARAVAILFRLILEAIVMYLLAKGAAAVGSRLRSFSEGLKKSKQEMRGFAEWVDRNYKGMIEDPRLNPNLRKPKEGAGGEAATAKSASAVEPKKPATAEPAKPASARESKVRKIGNREPRNSKYAGKTYPPEKLPPDVRQKYPDSVRFTEDGFPDFTPYEKTSVKVDGLTGKNSDFTLANKASGYRRTPEGYTWHHNQDGKTMQLVPTDLHDAVSHTGGAAILRNQKK